MNSLKCIAATLLALSLAACGGGGGSAGTSPFDTTSGGSAGCTATSASGVSTGASGVTSAGCTTAATLSLQLDTASITNTGASTVKATATASTATGQVLSGIPVSFSVDNGATFSQSSTATTASGQVVATVSIGSDSSNRIVTVTATSGTLTAKGVFAITGANLSGTRVPATVTPGSTGNRVDFRLIDANGRAMVAQAISVTAGSLAAVTGVTGANGDYSYVYTAPSTLGALNIVATAGGVSNTQTVSVQASASTIPAAVGPINSASVSANPSVVSTNTATTNNRTEVRALFVGNNNAAIKNVRVRFDLNGDPASIGGTFTTGASVVYSDDSGIATSAYIPGTRSSPTNGVTIRACYDIVDFASTACPNAATATITVASDPLSVTIGSNADIGTGTNNLTYTRQFVVLVVDASGRAKGNVDIIPSIDLDTYYKGYYIRQTTWVFAAGSPYACVNEDFNRNGILEASDDINHSGALEPRKSDVAISIIGNGKTSDAGTAIVQIEYPQNVASWLKVKILVSATGIAGTEGRATWTEILPVPAAALTAAGSPPFQFSPYGVTTSNSTAAIVAPDGTTLPAGTPPCAYPY